MRPSLVVGSIGLLAAAALAGPAEAGSSPTSKTCPTAAVVNKALGTHVKAPVTSTTPYSKTCTYAGTGVSSVKITFQQDTLAQFNVDEKAVGSMAVKVKGLGQGAWTSNEGSLYVYDNGIQYKILALLVATPKLEALARTLI
jgi:hypothetical protein